MVWAWPLRLHMLVQFICVRRPAHVPELARCRSPKDDTHSPAGISNNLSVPASSVSIEFGSAVVKGGSMGCGSIGIDLLGGNKRLENICLQNAKMQRGRRAKENIVIGPSQRLTAGASATERDCQPPHTRSGKRPHD